MDLIKKYWIAIMAIFGLCMFINIALCSLILGSLAIFIGFSSVIFLRKIRKTGIDWTGTIIEYKSDSDGNRIPIIEFTTIEGDFVREEPAIYASTDFSKILTYSDDIDQSVAILYDPDDPEKFVIKGEEGFNYIIIFFIVLVGLFFVGLTISSLLGYIKME